MTNPLALTNQPDTVDNFACRSASGAMVSMGNRPRPIQRGRYPQTSAAISKCKPFIVGNSSLSHVPTVCRDTGYPRRVISRARAAGVRCPLAIIATFNRSPHVSICSLPNAISTYFTDRSKQVILDSDGINETCISAYFSLPAHLPRAVGSVGQKLGRLFYSLFHAPTVNRFFC